VCVCVYIYIYIYIYTGDGDLEEKRRSLHKLRVEQENYYTKKFRRIYPLWEDDKLPESVGKDSEADSSMNQGPVMVQSGRDTCHPDGGEQRGASSERSAPVCDEEPCEKCWDFLHKGKDEDASRNAKLMQEYMQCARASTEIFEQSMWMKLGKGAGSQVNDKKKVRIPANRAHTRIWYMCVYTRCWVTGCHEYRLFITTTLAGTMNSQYYRTVSHSYFYYTSKPECAIPDDCY
jgi:hypothetical protein